MWKPISQFFILICAIVVAALAAVICLHKNDFDTYLDASNFVESPESKKYRESNPDLVKNNEVENSFLTFSYDNYGLYNYEKGNYSIEDSSFSGNIESYNKVKNDAIDISLWKNDFMVVNLVIKTKDEYLPSDPLNIKIVNDEQSSLNVQSGYLRYIGGNRNQTAESIAMTVGTSRSLLAPDAITDNQSINMKKNNVYLFRIRIDRMSDDNDNRNKIIKVKLSDKENTFIDTKQINVRKVNKSLLDVNSGDDYLRKYKTQMPSFNLLDFPTLIAWFYNHGIYGNDLNQPNIPDQFKEDPDDRMSYMEWNWKKYWEPEFKYHFDNFGEGSYFVADIFQDSKQLNPNDWEANDSNNGKWNGYKKSNLWNFKLEDNAWFIPKIKDNKVLIDIDDWEPLDFYIYNMSKIGYRNLLIDDFILGNGRNSTFFVWNDKTQKWELKSYNRTKTAYNDNAIADTINEGIIRSWVKHLDFLSKNQDYKFNWMYPLSDSKMTVQFNFDETSIKYVKKVTDTIKKIKNEGNNICYSQFLKTYESFRVKDGMDRKGNWIKDISDVDTVYFDSQSFYNEGNKRLHDLFSKNIQSNKVYGQYQLSNHTDFDLFRANPGNTIYEMMVLNKEHEPHYMKFIMNRWESVNNYYSSDISGGPAGNALWEYPYVNSFGGLRNDKPIKINPSVRLESLALGVNMVQKVNILVSDGLLNESMVDSFIGPLLTDSWTQSANIFNFDQDNVEISANGFDESKDYICDYLTAKKCRYGQIDSIKKIQSIVNKAM